MGDYRRHQQERRGQEESDAEVFIGEDTISSLRDSTGLQWLNSSKAAAPVRDLLLYLPESYPLSLQVVVRVISVTSLHTFTNLSESVTHSVVSISLQPLGLYAACQVPLSMEFSRQEHLEWVAVPFSRVSSQPRDSSWVSCTAGRFFTI